ncbi:MFS transporter [Paenibacillus sp. WLX1005]|uniref:MFS transporter n=1 Tax=Paenibacillus sp. WLX1005 TaxID=3243766 RepID=UPI0039840829
MLTSKQKILTFALALITFTVGTSELVIVGLLTQIASDLRVSLASAGILITGFAISYALVTPFVTGYMSKFPKRPVVLTLILIFILSNIAGALTSSFIFLLCTRVITAVVSGVLTALSMTIASDFIPADKRSSVVSIIFAGFTTAHVLGVPLGTFIGQISSWHYTFWATAGLGTMALILSWFVIPPMQAGQPASVLKHFVIFKNLPIVIGFLIPAVSLTGSYTLYTYISPIIEEQMKIPSQYTGAILLAYGIFSIFSNYVSGYIASRNGLSKLRIGFILQAAVLASFYFTMHTTITGIISIMLMGVFIYIMNATIQLFLMDQGAQYSAATRDFAASLTAVSGNVGITLGSLFGSIVVAYGQMQYLAITGAVCALIASLLATIGYRLQHTSHSVQK